MPRHPVNAQAYTLTGSSALNRAEALPDGACSHASGALSNKKRHLLACNISFALSLLTCLVILQINADDVQRFVMTLNAKLCGK